VLSPCCRCVGKLEFQSVIIGICSSGEHRKPSVLKQHDKPELYPITPPPLKSPQNPSKKNSHPLRVLGIIAKQHSRNLMRREMQLDQGAASSILNTAVN